MALNQQGASWLNKIQVWKILEDERDKETPLGVIFMSQAFSQLNIGVTAVGLRLHGALSSWGIVLKPGFGGYNLIHKGDDFFSPYIFLHSMQVNIPQQPPVPPWKQEILLLKIPSEGVIFLVSPKTLVANHYKGKNTPSSSKFLTQMATSPFLITLHLIIYTMHTL